MWGKFWIVNLCHRLTVQHSVELIVNHMYMDHWFEIDIVRDERFEEILKHAVSEETPEAANTPEETPEAADRQPRGGLAYPQLLWPGGRVPYLFHGFVSKSYNAMVMEECG